VVILIPPKVHKSLLSSVICNFVFASICYFCFCDNTQSDWGKIIPYYGFDLHF
jgi:hypothetical protein